MAPSFPYEITFVDSAPSAAIHARAESLLARLERHGARIMDAEVRIRIPHHHGRHRFFHVHLQIDLPGHRIVVDREPEKDEGHTNIHRALQDAFDKARRQIDHLMAPRDLRAAARAEASP